MSAARRELLAVEVPFGLIGACLVALAALFAEMGVPRWLPPSPLVAVGLPSPLTGMTRSFVAIASGDAARAFAFHPLGPLAFAVAIAAPLVAIASWVRGRRFAVLSGAARSRTVWLAIASVGVAAWIRQLVTIG